VVTDTLSGGAIRAAGYDVPRASVRALRVGADMLLFSAEPGQVADVAGATVRAVVAAVRAGNLSRSRLRAAVLHVLDAKQVRLCS
jgi:beta-glucosidase-like glycosyl hydrolase